MAVGESKWSSKGKDVQRFNREPVPAGDYDLKLTTQKAEIKKGKVVGKVPYVNAGFPMLGTADSENGKDKLVFHMFFLQLKPSPKDGKVMPERQGGVLDLAKALGQDVEFDSVVVPYQEFDDKGAPKGQRTTMRILDPRQVLAWLKGLDGTVVRAKIKVQKANGSFDAQNKVDYFIPSEDAGATEEEELVPEEETDEDIEELEEELEDDASEDLEETEEEADTSDDSAEDEAGEEEEDVSDLFKPKKGAPKPGPKVKQGPPAKGKKAKR